MNRQKITHNLSKVLLTLLFTVGSLLLVSTRANAAGPISVTLKSAGEDGTIREMEELDSILKNVPGSAQIAFSVDAPNCVRFSYVRNTKNEGKTYNSTSLTISGSQLKNYSDFSLEAVNATPENAPATATVKISNGGAVIDQITYSVTVTRVTPRFQKKISPQKVRTYVDHLDFDIDNVSVGATIRLWASKSLVYCCSKTTYTKLGAEKTSTKEIKISTKPTAPTDITGLFDNEEYADEYIVSKASTGKISLHALVEQDGRTYEKIYNFTATKYESPFKTLKINGLNLAKKFGTRTDLSDGNGLSPSWCKKTAKKQSRYTCKMKKGYKLEKITYRLKEEYAWKKPRFLIAKEGSGHLPQNFWELHFKYRDKNGKKWENRILFSISIF